MLGLLLGGFFFLLTSMALGRARRRGGALTGLGMDGGFVKEVNDSLKPDSSALFLIVRDVDETAALALLRN